ncbi:hypothetical protein DV738_g5507, partial [Chaetothyriales sp. CBS 135597]
MSSLSNSLTKTLSTRHGRVVVIAAASTAAAGILLIGIPAIRLATLHARLDKAITSFWSMGPYAKQAAAGRSGKQALLPPEVAAAAAGGHNGSDDHDDDEYRIFYEVATKTVAKAQLQGEVEQGEGLSSSSYEELLTRYLRHTMVEFQRFPQAWVLWLVTAAAAGGKEGRRRTFDKRYLASLPFEAGDVVNGVYKVLGREGSVVVFGMAQGAVEGRMVVSIGDERERLDARTGAWVAVAQVEGGGDKDEQDRAVVKNELFMWVKRSEGVVMPMERSVPRWLHEVANWWLMDEGTRWLASTEGK